MTENTKYSFVIGKPDARMIRGRKVRGCLIGGGIFETNGYCYPLVYSPPINKRGACEGSRSNTEVKDDFCQKINCTYHEI